MLPMQIGPVSGTSHSRRNWAIGAAILVIFGFGYHFIASNQVPVELPSENTSEVPLNVRHFRLITCKHELREYCCNFLFGMLLVPKRCMPT
jgi:hypothetical protein